MRVAQTQPHVQKSCQGRGGVFVLMDDDVALPDHLWQHGDKAGQLACVDQVLRNPARQAGHSQALDRSMVDRL